jgi:hypothetical protein
MHGLRQDIDLSFLYGRELVQLAIGLYQIILRFDEEVAISVEGEFRYFDGQDEWAWRPEPGSSLCAAHVASSLGMTIDSVRGDANGTLVLVFSNSHRLTLMDANKEYESYDITRAGQTIVV